MDDEPGRDHAPDDRQAFVRHVGPDEDGAVGPILRRYPDERSSSRTHEMQKRQLTFAFWILAATLISIALMCATALLFPPSLVIERLQQLETTDSFKWMTGIVNTIVGGAIGLALGSYYSQDVRDR